MIRSPDPLAAVQGAYVFAVLPPDAQAGLARLAREEVYPEESLLVRLGETPDRLWFVCEGGVQLGMYRRDGEAMLLSPIVAGGWATWIACFIPGPLPHDLWTMPSTRLLGFPVDAVRHLAEAYPEIYPRVIERIGDRVRDLIRWSFAGGLAEPKRRLAVLLAQICREHRPGQDGPHEIPLTLERIGRMGFGSRQLVARSLTVLEAEGIVERSYGRILVRSLRALDEYASATIR
jgi:CRP-like cAMP-binding protein